MAKDPLQKAARWDAHWTKEYLSDLDSEELATMAAIYGIDHEGKSWDEVEDLLLQIQGGD